MDDHGVRAGAAKSRRCRRLRAWHRHVRTTVAMELATALHHSAQRVEVPTEGEVHEKHDGLRAQKPPLPGTRPGVLPQVGAATVGYVAAPVPLLSAPMLADTAPEAVDARTVHFLLTDAVKHLKEGRKMEEEEERRWMAPVKAMTELSRQLPRKRKRKKRKKRKLPRAPLPRGGRACALQRQVPAVQVVHVLEGAPEFIDRVLDFSVAQRRRGTHSATVQKIDLFPQVQFLGKVVAPVLCNDRCFVRWCRKPVEFPQVQFLVKVICPLLSCLMLLVRQRRKLWSFRSCSPSKAVDIPFVTQKLIPTVQTIQQIIEILHLLFVLGGRCPCCAGRADSQVLPWRRRSCSHSCSSLRNRCPLFPTTGALWFRLQNTAEFPQLQFMMVVDIPVEVPRPFPMVLLFSRP